MAARASSSKSNVSKTLMATTKRKLAQEAAKKPKKPTRRIMVATTTKRKLLATVAGKNPKKRKRTKVAAAAATTCPYLPDELWERIFKFLNDDVYENINDYDMLDLNPHNRSLESISVVSKQFLSITNRIRFFVTISYGTIPFLRRLFERFPNATSLKITLYSKGLNEILTEISNFPLDLKWLSLNHFARVPTNGLRDLSKKMKNLTSLTCYKMNYIHKNDLFFIADCFPLLEELSLTSTHGLVLNSDDQFLELPKLRKIALSRFFIGHNSIDNLCKNCGLLQEVKVIDYPLRPRYAPVFHGRPDRGASGCHRRLGRHRCHPQYREALGCPRYHPRYREALGCRLHALL